MEDNSLLKKLLKVQEASKFENAPLILDRIQSSVYTEMHKLISTELSTEEKARKKANIANLKLNLMNKNFTVLKSYMDNKEMVTEVAKDKTSKEKLDEIINQIFENTYHSILTTNVYKKRIDDIRNIIKEQVNKIYEEATNYMYIHQKYIDQIVTVFSIYFEKHQILPKKDEKCQCLSNQLNSIYTYCKSGGKYEEAKEGLKISFNCPSCKDFKEQIITMLPKSTESTITTNVRYQNITKLMNIYLTPCRQCKLHQNQWNKVMINCGCIYCIPCLKTRCRIAINCRILEKCSSSQFALCLCGKDINSSVTNIALGEDLDNIHRALSLMYLSKAKGTADRHLLCIRCGAIKKMGGYLSNENYVCCH